MIAVIDYGAGNLCSVANALEAIGKSIEIVQEAKDLARFHQVILPGVGHFESMMAALDARGFKGPLLDHLAQEKPFLGICLGMQALFESSDEAPGVPGFGWFKGTVRRLPSARVPHIGWNEVRFLDGTVDWFAFANSYAVMSSDAAWGTTHDGEPWVAAVKRNHVTGCQFHPEKSGKAGLALLKAWCDDGC